MNEQLTRAYRQVTMPAAKLESDDLSQDERAWVEARTREMVEQAQGAGLSRR